MRIRCAGAMPSALIGTWIAFVAWEGWPLGHAMASEGQPAAERPNLVLIIADDLGRDWLGSYGSEEYVTPNLDRLAAARRRLTGILDSFPPDTPLPEFPLRYDEINKVPALPPGSGRWEAWTPETKPKKEKNKRNR